MSTMIYVNHHRSNSPTERIVAIVYHPTSTGRLLPFQVFTASDKDPKCGYWNEYDLEWCERDHTLYYHASGSGAGGFYMHPLCKPHTNPRCAVWYDHALVKPTNGGNCSKRVIGDKTLHRWGYEVIQEPLVVLENTNPFDVANDGGVEYCAVCDDWLPAEELCNHIWYCEKCGDYSKPKERCKHRRC